MTHSTKRIATIHTQNHHTSHKTYHKSHKTYHKSHKTYHTSHKSHMIHDMQTSLDAFSSLPTLEAVYEMILKWSLTCQRKSSTNLHFKTYRLRVGKALVAFFFLFLQKLEYWTTEPCTSPKGRRRSCYGVCLITGCRKLIKYKKQRVMRVERWSEGTDGNLVEAKWPCNVILLVFSS